MAIHNDIGTWGESTACEFLVSKGYAIKERNARIGKYEIDIVAFKGTRIVFVEVKTRHSSFDQGIESITPQKILRLSRAADAYITSHQIPLESQFDVIVITGSPNGKPKIIHYPDAFQPPLTSL